MKEKYLELSKFGFDSFFEQQVTEEDLKQNLIPARITEGHREEYKVATEQGTGRAKLKASVFYSDGEYVQFPAVGDFVMLIFNPHGDHFIYRILERKTCFTRKSPDKGRGEQVVSANFNWVFIMTSLNQNFSPGRLLRYATIAFQSGAVPVIILTKTDLCEDYEKQVFEASKAVPGVDIVGISSITGDGIDRLAQYLKPRDTIVFMGSSGVGKSSLLNILSGEDKMAVQQVRETDAKGRHTTTHRQLFLLESGAIVIDTPGMRELGIWGDTSDGLFETFSEIEELAKECRFRNCSHNKEPGCGIRAALQDGRLSEKRWKDYQKLQKEILHAAKKERAYELKRKKRMVKQVTK